MKVKELIAQLQLLPQDADVHLSYNYGDYWNTQIAPKVHRVNQGTVQHSSHLRDDAVVEEWSADDQVNHVVLIS